MLRAEDAVNALDVARAEVPDVVVSDVMMPGRSGLDLVADGATVVLVSAWALAAEVAEGLSAGAVDHVTEPFDPYDLAERVHQVLDATGSGG